MGSKWNKILPANGTALIISYNGHFCVRAVLIGLNKHSWGTSFGEEGRLEKKKLNCWKEPSKQICCCWSNMVELRAIPVNERWEVTLPVLCRGKMNTKRSCLASKQKELWGLSDSWEKDRGSGAGWSPGWTQPETPGLSKRYFPAANKASPFEWFALAKKAILYSCLSN